MIKQLIYNDKFNTIIDEPLHYWKGSKDLPEPIIEFIKTSSLTDLDIEYNCPVCGRILNEDFYCYFCSTDLLGNYMENYRLYYVFDILDNEVILYIIRERQNISDLKEKRQGKLTIEKAYHVKQEMITDLIEGVCYTYSSLDEKFNLYDDNYNHCKKYLYTDNLEKLKDTIYQYTHIWDSISYLTQHFSISKLTYIPLHFPQFEYLIKYKLYDLAYNSSPLFQKKGFKDIFGVTKDYLSFMQRININYQQLKALQFCKEKDLETIQFVIKYQSKIESILKKVTIPVKKIKNYLNFQNTYHCKIDEYDDYLQFCIILGYDINNKEILYPEDLSYAHDVLLEEVKIITDSNINKKIKQLSNMLSFNYYEDNQYIIFPATSVEELLDEGEQQKNCLRTYCQQYSNNECQIYFMREKNNKSKSLVTIEVRNCHIIQAREKFNKIPRQTIKNVLKKWEKTLIPIDNEN